MRSRFVVVDIRKTGEIEGIEGLELFDVWEFACEG